MAFKEIVTKAVIGKGKKYFKDKYSIELENIPSTVLGCWVINHKFEGYKDKNSIGVDGSYDVNIWYSYDNDSKTSVVSKNITYNDLFNVNVKENADLSSDTEIIVRSLKQPSCSNVSIDNNIINFDIEKELGVEVVGETKMKIQIEETEEPWQDLNNLEESIDNIDQEYLK